MNYKGHHDPHPSTSVPIVPPPPFPQPSFLLLLFILVIIITIACLLCRKPPLPAFYVVILYVSVNI